MLLVKRKEVRNKKRATTQRCRGANEKYSTRSAQAVKDIKSRLATGQPLLRDVLLEGMKHFFSGSWVKMKLVTLPTPVVKLPTLLNLKLVK